MAQILVRDLEEDVKAGLKRRAVRHGRSMEEEAREILRTAVRADKPGATPLGSRIARRFAKIGLSVDLPELRGQPATAAHFKK